MHNENMEEIKSISMQNVTFSYKGKKRYVFEDFSVDIEPNHITGIIGRNGQGKTTLMNLIAGKFEPDEGIIEIDGKNPVTDIGTAKRIVYVGSRKFVVGKYMIENSPCLYRSTRTLSMIIQLTFIVKNIFLFCLAVFYLTC